MTTTPTLRDAAQAVLTRWESPLWRQEVGTYELMKDLRAALAALAAPADALAHEIWAVAQLAPGEGVEDGVARIAALLPGVPADALAEPVAFRMRYRSEPGMIGHYPWSYLEHGRRSKTPHPAHEYEDLYAAPPATQLQQAVARALEELKFHPQASHVEPNYRDWFNKTIDAAIRTKGQQ